MKIDRTTTMHRKQYDVVNDPARIVVVCAGRRAGKTESGLIKTRQLLERYNPAQKTNAEQHILVAMPSLKQARAVWWAALKNRFVNHPLVMAVSETDFRIVTRKPYPDIILRGTNDRDGDSLRGIEIYGAVLDEFADIKPNAWYEAIFPACKGQILIIGTPKGRSGLFYEMYHSPETSSHHFVTADNPFYPRQQIINARAILSDRAFRQEFMASWEDYEGLIFTGYTDACRKIIQQPMDYYLGVDWGDRNPAVVVVGVAPNIHYVCESWTNNTNLPVTNQYLIGGVIKKLYERYKAKAVFMPDDRTGSVFEARNNYGLPAIAVKRNKPGVRERIEIVNSLFTHGNIIINPALTELHANLTAYRFDDNLKPIGTDHDIDAMSYCIAALNYKRFNALWTSTN